MIKYITLSIIYFTYQVLIPAMIFKDSIMYKKKVDILSANFDVWNCCKIHMSIWWGKSDIGLIMTVHKSVLSFHGKVCFSVRITNFSNIFDDWKKSKMTKKLKS